MTEEEYKASCNSVSYIEIARNPNNYIGQKAVFGNQISIPHIEAEYIEIN